MGLGLVLFCCFIILHRCLLSHGPKWLSSSSHLITFQPTREEKGQKRNNPLFKEHFLKVVYIACTYTILSRTQSQSSKLQGRTGNIIFILGVFSSNENELLRSLTTRSIIVLGPYLLCSEIYHHICGEIKLPKDRSQPVTEHIRNINTGSFLRVIRLL